MMLRIFTAEFLTTFTVTAFTCLACSLTKENVMYFSIICGILVTITRHCFASVSGAHGNPAVSVMRWALGSLKAKKLLLYLVAQFLGAATGHVVGNICAGNSIDTDYCILASHAALSENGKLILAEFLLTMVTLLVWCATWANKEVRLRSTAHLAIGAVHCLCVLIGLRMTGANLNPARTLVPCIFTKSLGKAHLLAIGQLASSICAAIFWKTFCTKTC